MKSRLKKISKYFDSIKSYGKIVDIFINPTNAEIAEAKKASGDNIVRGVILDDGTEYCWEGWTLHFNVSKVVNIESFHFSYGDGYGWFCDACRIYTKQQFLELLIKYENKLAKYGNVNDCWDIGSFSDYNETIKFCSFDEIKESLEDEINKNKQIVK